MYALLIKQEHSAVLELQRFYHSQLTTDLALSLSLTSPVYIFTMYSSLDNNAVNASLRYFQIVLEILVTQFLI